MTYNLSIWREDKPEALHFSRMFSRDLWTYGDPRLEELGWLPFAYEGQPHTNVGEIWPDHYRVHPERLLEWLTHLQEIVPQYRERVPLYYMLWKRQSTGTLESTQLIFEAQSHCYLLQAEAFDFVMKSIPGPAELDLSTQIAVLKLHSVEQMTVQQMQNCLQKTIYELEYANVIDYFQKDLQDLYELAESASRDRVMLLHECS